MVPVGIHIMQMNMAMKQVPRFEPLHERQKSREPLVTTIGIIAKAKGSCMGDEYIHPPSSEQTVEQQSWYHFQHPEIHLPFRILVCPLVVAHRATETCNNQIVLLVIENLAVRKLPTKGRKGLHLPILVPILVQ